MAEFSKFIPTNKGVALISKVVAGSSGVQFTRFGLSATSYREDQIPALTSVSNIKQYAPVSRVVKSAAAAITVEGAVDNSNLTTSYNLCSIALYAVDPDEGEILYGVSPAKVNGFVPAYNGITVSAVYLSIITAISNTANVSLIVDPAAVATIANIQALEAEISDIRAFIGYNDKEIYGVEVDFKNKRFTRLAAAVGMVGGSAFDSVKAFGGRKRCNLTNTGVLTAYHGAAGYTETGKTLADISVGGQTIAAGTPVQVMVEQPAFYYKVVPLELEQIADGKGFHMRKGRYYISDTMKPGFKLHPAFISNGEKLDKIYLSAFEGCLWDTSATAYINNDEQIADFAADMLSSISGAKPASGLTQNLTRDNARKLCHNRGAGWELSYCATASASQLLMLIEYATFNMQTAIGAGNVNKTNDGASNMAEITGATTLLGNKSGAVENANGIQLVTYRGEENPWGNIWKFVDGMNINAKGIHELYVADHDFANSKLDGAYTNTGFTLAKVNGYVSAFGYAEAFDWLFAPTEVLGNSALPVGDYFYQANTSNNIMIALLGADWSDGAYAGAFYWHVCSTPSNRGRSVGGRPVYIPRKSA